MIMKFPGQASMAQRGRSDKLKALAMVLTAPAAAQAKVKAATETANITAASRERVAKQRETGAWGRTALLTDTRLKIASAQLKQALGIAAENSDYKNRFLDFMQKKFGKEMEFGLTKFLEESAWHKARLAQGEATAKEIAEHNDAEEEVARYVAERNALIAKGNLMMRGKELEADLPWKEARTRRAQMETDLLPGMKQLEAEGMRARTTRTQQQTRLAPGLAESLMTYRKEAPITAAKNRAAANARAELSAKVRLGTFRASGEAGVKKFIINKGMEFLRETMRTSPTALSDYADRMLQDPKINAELLTRQAEYIQRVGPQGKKKELKSFIAQSEIIETLFQDFYQGVTSPQWEGLGEDYEGAGSMDFFK